MSINTNAQLSLSLFAQDTMGKVYESKDILSKGVSVGRALVVSQRKHVADQLNLKGKANRELLEDTITEQGQEAFRLLKGQVAALDEGWCLHRLAKRQMADGLMQVSFVIREAKKKLITAEKIAKALGYDEADVEAALAALEEKKQEAEKATIEADAS